MMINKRLIGTVAESKKYIAGNVVLQWCSLAANIAMMFSITNYQSRLPVGDGGCGGAGAPHPVPVYHRGFQDELPFFQSGEENPAGTDL